MSNDRTPEQQLNERLYSAEVGVLGSMLIDQDAVGPMLAAVDERDFLTAENRNIFRAFKALYSQGRPADGASPQATKTNILDFTQATADNRQ